MLQIKFNLQKSSLLLEHGNTEQLYTQKFINNKGFPSSYIEFVEEFGYGLSLDLVIIYIPMSNYADSFYLKCEEIISSYQEVLDDENELWFDLEPDLIYERLKDMIPFAKTENGDYFFWDIESGSKKEFAIYVTNFRGTGFTKVADNLYDLLDRLASDFFSPSMFPNNLPNTFQPYKRL